MIRNFVERLMNGLLLDEPGDTGGGGGGGTNTDGNRAPDNNGATKPGDGNAQLTGNVKPDTGGTKPVEDPRIKGLLADLQKERAARQRFENDHRTTAAELERERKRVLALSGINPRSKEQEDEDLIRERLNRLYPGLAELTPEDLKALREARGQMDEIRNATTGQWKAHGQKMLTAVTTAAQKGLGGGKLSDRQSARIQQAYVEEARSNPDFLARHEAGDPGLVDEFVNGWLEDFAEPARRSALQQETLSARRPRVPGGKDRSIVGANDKPIDVKDDTAVGDLLVKGFKERGGQFGRR